MYSVVLMAALTAGSATPDWRCGCHGGWGCCGCWGGCWGGCYGCWGGCWGGCYGGWGGCWGGCYGGWGGCYGCWGGYSSWGCAGCLGGYGYGGVGYPGSIYQGGMIAPAPGTGAPAGEALPTPSEDKSKKGTMLTPTKAKLVVELPANAKLFIDDMPMKADTRVRSFNTPALEPGQAYYYMVRVETMHDGKPVSETRRVIVRAGQVARADFKDMESESVRTAQAK
jgi:uncharacterized protein (TIGR03000 family)